MKIGEQLATQLRAAMEAEGMTQAQLCREMGVTQKHVSLMLNGKAGASLGLWDYAAYTLNRTWTVELSSGSDTTPGDSDG
jgi:transcriptional regulator with XRE-family HTH domain